MHQSEWAARWFQLRENNWTLMMRSAAKYLDSAVFRSPQFWLKAMYVAHRAYLWIDKGRGREERNRRCNHIGFSLPELLDIYMDAYNRMQEAKQVTPRDWELAQLAYHQNQQDVGKRMASGDALRKLTKS